MCRMTTISQAPPVSIDVYISPPQRTDAQGDFLCKQVPIYSALKLTTRLWLLFLLSRRRFFNRWNFNSFFFGGFRMFSGVLFSGKFSSVRTTINFPGCFSWHRSYPFVLDYIVYSSPKLSWVISFLFFSSLVFAPIYMFSNKCKTIRLTAKVTAERIWLSMRLIAINAPANP